MMPRIKVTSRSFSGNEELRQSLRNDFPDAVFNEEGRSFTTPELIDYLSDADGAIIALEILDRPVIDSLPKLRVVAKYGVGLDNIDVEYLRATGRSLAWQGGVNRRAVAELALCFMIGLSRNVFGSGRELSSGRWNPHGGVDLTGKTIGIVGCGYVGMDLLSLLQPFRCRLLVNDILDRRAAILPFGAQQADFANLLAESDVLSLHIPLTPETRNMIDRESLGRMRPSAVLINTSRGGVVDQEALCQALRDGTIAGAALDVFVEEPPIDRRMFELKNLMMTPHIGGSSREAIRAMGEAAIQGLRDHFRS